MNEQILDRIKEGITNYEGKKRKIQRVLFEEGLVEPLFEMLRLIYSELRKRNILHREKLNEICQTIYKARFLLVCVIDFR